MLAEVSWDRTSDFCVKLPYEDSADIAVSLLRVGECCMDRGPEATDYTILGDGLAVPQGLVFPVQFC